MKGIILAGGSGTRLHPTTIAVSKQLLPVFDKPMIYYSLATMLLSETRDILIISTPEAISAYKQLLSDGTQWGVKFTYVTQDRPNGLAESFLLGEEFIANSPVQLILGDNIFYGAHLSSILSEAQQSTVDHNKAVIFTYQVNDPHRYGIIEFDAAGNPTGIIEKPEKTTSNSAVTGMYFYPNKVIEYAKQLSPSSRGELEISDINDRFLRDNELEVKALGRGFIWLDTGTPVSLLEASNIIYGLEKSQKQKVACLEEIVYYKGYISKQDLIRLSQKHKNPSYARYLLDLANK